jgi:alkanesulfonate monooxygenase SsuD/methylene tetrahydromethanopterin reductase-like flavin-dependent oxidoreductase (luciferase family)
MGLPILTFPSTISAELLQTQIDTYRRVYRQHGHDEAAMRIAFTAFSYVEPSRDQANRIFETGMERYFGILDRLTRVEASAEAAQQVYDRIPTTGRVTGSPADAIERVHWIRDTFGVTDIINVTHYAGVLSHDQVMGSMRLWAEQVMPAFATDALALR